MDWENIILVAVLLFTYGCVFWLGLTGGYRMKFRRASRLTWPERPTGDLWSAEFRDDRLIELGPLTADGLPTFRRVER